MSLADLDDLEAISRLDSLDVLGVVERFPDQILEGWELGRATTELPDATGVESVVLLGMGGSGVSGDVARSIVEPRLPIPFRVIKSYGPLPEWVGRNSIVFAVSYSGGTEETLAAVEEAHERGCRIVTISSGGDLAERATRYGLAHVRIPSGRQPRASLGYLAMPVLAVLVSIGLVPDLRSDVDEAVRVLEDLASKCHRKIAAPENPAKELASRLAGRIPVAYGGHGLGATVAYRFKCDVNEYAKSPAFWAEIPELNHNEITGWVELADVTSERFALVLIRDPEDHERIKLRFDVTQKLLEDRFAEVIELSPEGTSALARLLSLILLTQMAAIYLGIAYGVDPGPVEVIERLKVELAER